MTQPAAYCTSQDVLTRVAGMPVDMSGVYRGAIAEKIPEVCADIDREIRIVRGQAEGWSFLGASEHEVQLVSFTSSQVSAGTFVLALGNLVTGDIAWNADSAALQAALDAAFGAGAITCSPVGAGGPFRLTFAAAGPQDLLVPIAALTPAQAYLVVERLVPGVILPAVSRYTGSGSSYLPIDDSVAVSRVSLLNPDGSIARDLALESDYLPVPLNGLPITGLERIGAWWPRQHGGIRVERTPGYDTAVRPDVREVAIVEVIRSYFGDRASNNDVVQLSPFGKVTIARAFTSKLAALCDAYRRGDAMFRSAT